MVCGLRSAVRATARRRALLAARNAAPGAAPRRGCSRPRWTPRTSYTAARPSMNCTMRPRRVRLILARVLARNGRGKYALACRPPPALNRRSGSVWPWTALSTARKVVRAVLVSTGSVNTGWPPLRQCARMYNYSGDGPHLRRHFSPSSQDVGRCQQRCPARCRLCMRCLRLAAPLTAALPSGGRSDGQAGRPPSGQRGGRVDRSVWRPGGRAAGRAVGRLNNQAAGPPVGRPGGRAAERSGGRAAKSQPQTPRRNVGRFPGGGAWRDRPAGANGAKPIRQQTKAKTDLTP